MQERRKQLVSYQKPEDNEETSEAIPEWMKTRASIFKKSVDENLGKVIAEWINFINFASMDFFITKMVVNFFGGQIG